MKPQIKLTTKCMKRKNKKKKNKTKQNKNQQKNKTKQKQKQNQNIQKVQRGQNLDTIPYIL